MIPPMFHTVVRSKHDSIIAPPLRHLARFVANVPFATSRKPEGTIPAHLRPLMKGEKLGSAGHDYLSLNASAMKMSCPRALEPLPHHRQHLTSISHL